MGSPDNETNRNASEGPQHEVVLTGPFYMGVHDVTVGQFKAFVKETGYQTEPEKGGGAYRFTDGSWQLDPLANWQNPGFEQTRRPSGGLRELERCQCVLQLAEQEGRRSTNCRRRRNGSTPAGRGRRRPTPSATTPRTSATTPGTRTIRGPHPSRGREEAQSVGPVRHARQRLAMVRRRPAGVPESPPLKNLLKILKVLITEAVSFAAVRGATTNRGSAARPTATASIPASASLSAASGSCCVFPPGLRNYLYF